MSQENKQTSLIQQGKQLGSRFSFSENGEVIWSSVGIQMHNGKFKVYVDEIEEGKMNTEDYRKELCLIFDNLSDALNWIEANTCLRHNDLAPCKGQKIFNPELFS